MPDRVGILITIASCQPRPYIGAMRTAVLARPQRTVDGTVRPAPGSPAAARILALQRAAGNAAVAKALTVSRCGPDNPGCSCPEEVKDSVPVQRDYPGLTIPEQLKFTNRVFTKDALPVCPNCHRDKPTTTLPPEFQDREATEPRLVAWAGESEKILQQDGTARMLQLDPQGTDSLVDSYGVGLTNRITSSHEFEGSDPVREQGAQIIRKHWPEVRPPVRQKLIDWYQNELFTAVSLTPEYATPLLQPDQLRRVLTAPFNERAPLGRWGAEAAVGQTYGIFAIDDIGAGSVWFHRPGRPLWLYQISQTGFIKHDPFVAAVAEQVYDRTRWVLQMTPLLLKAGAFALGFSGSIALVIAGIAIDELAEEMKADAEGRPGRSPLEILESAGMQLLIDRIFHGLFGGFGGRAAASGGKLGAKIEKIAEKAVPAIRAELVAAEKPLVKEALEAGTARKVTDKALRAEGYAVEVAVENAGQQHLFRLNGKGRWCRFSTPICDLDLGADVLTATKSPASFTKAKLADVRQVWATAKEEMDFLSRVYDRMRTAGRMDVSLLSAEERAMLDQLAPTGKAADLSLAQLRELPTELGLKKDLASAASQEADLIKQLYREGRPLYEVMRAASPSSAARTVVLGDALGLDAASTLRPRSGSLAVDHVVPLNEIVRMPGFDKLRPERQLAIVNDVKNLRAIDALANSSRGDRSWHAWAQAAIYYDAPAIARMRALEDSLWGYLQLRISTLLRP
jgi:hypothetical protein